MQASHDLLPSSDLHLIIHDTSRHSLQLSPSWFLESGGVSDQYQIMSQPPSPTTIPSHGASSAISREPLTLSQTEPQESNAAGVRVPRPSISFAGTEGGRRPSVQFDPGLSIEADRRIAKPNAPNPKLQRRMSSPPPPS